MTSQQLVQEFNNYSEAYYTQYANDLYTINVLGITLLPGTVKVRSLDEDTFTLECLEVPSAEMVTLPASRSNVEIILKVWKSVMDK